MSNKNLVTSLRISRILTTIVLLLLAVILLISSTNQQPLVALNEYPFPIVPMPEEGFNTPPYWDNPQSNYPSLLPKIDSDLQELAAEYAASPAAAKSFAQNRRLRVQEDRVQVRVLTVPGQEQTALSVIHSAGGNVTYISDLAPELQAWIPLSALEAVSQDSSITAIKRPARLVSHDVSATAATTEGLLPLNALAWHAIGQTGAGVKIALIDGGFLGYPSLLGTELPASVTIKNYVDGETDAQVDGTMEHGTAIAEIVHDIAPDAELYLVKIDTFFDLEEAVNYAISNSVDVISTSVGWYNLTPGDGTGLFADLAELARTNGITWATTAGNDRKTHWGGAFHNTDSDPYHEFSSGRDYNWFGPEEGYLYYIPAGVTIQVYLRWDDWTNVDQDYALLLLGGNPATYTWYLIITADAPQTGMPGQTPTEYINYTTTSSERPYAVVIKRVNSSRNVNLELFAPNMGGFDVWLADRSLPNLADAPAVITVGGVDAADPYTFQEYSSQGPTNGPGGTATGGFNKPDLVAYTNVSTEAYSPDPFGGTSASSPHVSAAAALVKGANPSFSPQQVRDALQNWAIDMGDTGLDTQYGYGRAYLAAEETIDIDIPLNEGWNMISSRANLNDPTLETLLADIESNMVLMKNEDGLVYWPDQSINEIGSWDVLEAYQIFMTDVDTLILTGQPVDPASTPIELPAGWSQVAYLRDSNLAIDQALASVSSDLYLAKCGTGEVYWPKYSIDQLGSMQPGQGYQLFMNSSGTLTYPAN